MSTETIKKALYAEFMKSNKVRREKLAKKYGYTDAAAYLAYLTNVDKVEVQKDSPSKPKQETINITINNGNINVAPVKPTIHNAIILDVSGSMAFKLQGAIQAINSEVKDLKGNTEANITFTGVNFSYNHSINTMYFMSPISEVGNYKANPSGNTALYQAVGQTINRLRATIKPGEKVLIKIFTDGGENDSNLEWKDGTKLKNLIKDVEKEGFTVTFVGTDYDVKTMVNNLGVYVSNTMSYDGTSAGLERSMKTSSVATKSYINKVAKGEDVLEGFYTKKIGKL